MNIDRLKKFLASCKRPRKESEMQAHVERDRLMLLCDRIPDGCLYLLEIDTKHNSGKMTYISATFEAITGISAEAVKENYMASLDNMHPDDIPDFLKLNEHCSATLTHFFCEVRKFVDNRWRWLQVSSFPRREDDIIYFDGIILDITARKEAELQLIKEKERLRAIGDNLPYGALFRCVRDTSVDTINMEYISATWEKVTGSSPEIVLGDFYHYLETVYPDDKEYLTNILNLSKTNLTQFNIEIRMVDDNNAIRWLHFVANPHIDENRILWDGIVHNITVRKESEQKLAIATNRIKMLGDYIPDGCLFRYAFDEKNNRHFMSYVSATWEAITGVPAADVLADFHNFFSVVHPDEAVQMQQAIDTAVKEKSDLYYEVCISYKGSQRWLQFSSHPHSEGDTWLWEGIIHDITARKNAEYQLVKEKEKAEEADELKSAFLANMSHEIRTPLNGILGFLKLMDMKNITPARRQEYINVINNSSAQLAKLIDDIIDISKIEARQLTICPSPLLLNEMMTDLWVFFETYLQSRNKERIELILDETYFINNFCIHADSVRLRQVLTNLIGNAVKFTDKGFIRYGYRQSAPDQLEFVVEDSGIGLSAYQKEIIFERFRQVEGAHRRYGGTGLGLTISRSLVQLMGGDMWVESTEGDGSSFYFTIPYMESVV